jgi:hypothetical protein
MSRHTHLRSFTRTSLSHSHFAILALASITLARTWRNQLLSRLACTPLYEHPGANSRTLYSTYGPATGTRINLCSCISICTND